MYIRVCVCVDVCRHGFNILFLRSVSSVVYMYSSCMNAYRQKKNI